MKVMNRVLGGIKLVGGLGMFASVCLATGPLSVLAPLVAATSTVTMASGAYALLTGRFDD